jgi:nucleoside-triphosphatase THEP1
VDEGTPRLLLEGRPGIGKTTVTRRLLQLLREAGVPVGGFTTGELRTGGHREGFLVEAVSGAREVLAHVDLPGPPRVGRYGVDLAAFERVALPALGDSGPGGVVVVDELGRMELASAAFCETVVELLGGMWPWWPLSTTPATSSPMRSSAGPTSEWFGSPKRPAPAYPTSSGTG